MNNHYPSSGQGTRIIRNVSLTQSQTPKVPGQATFGTLLMSPSVTSGKDLGKHLKVLIKSILQ